MNAYNHCSSTSTGAKQNRSKKTKNSDTQVALPIFIDDLLEFIAKRLDVVSFCAFGATCKRTNKICHRIKEDFLQSLAPLVVFTSTHNMVKTSYLFDMISRKNMKLRLNNMDEKFLLGSTEGYMIFDKKRGHIFLVNPLTGHQLSYNKSSVILRSTPRHDHIIMATTLGKHNVLLAVSNDVGGWCEYQVFHSSSRIDGWLMHCEDEQAWVDVIVFKNRFYLLTSEAQLGEFKIEELYLKFNWPVVKNNPKVNSQDLKLVVSDDKLFMVDFVADEYFNIYKIDFDAMEWIKVDDLGEQALFLGGKLGSAMKKPSKWGYPSNCVYFLQDSPPRVCLYSMEGKIIDNFPIEGNPTSAELCSLGWYFPDQCMKVNYVVDE